MEVRFFVETVFENSEILAHDVGQVCRTPDDAGPESLELQLDEAKGLLKRLQETVLRDQIDELPRATRNWSACGKRRTIHDDRTRSLDTLYGRFRVKRPGFGGALARSPIVPPTLYCNHLFPIGSQGARCQNDSVFRLSSDRGIRFEKLPG